jgi:hypothetical protein
MPESNNLPQSVMEYLGQRVGSFAAFGGIDLGSAPELGESFPVWVLPANAIFTENPLVLAAPTGRWHHQIYRGGRAAIIAYSRPLGPRVEDWEIVAAFEGDNAEQVDRAITLADKLGASANEPRLLNVPAYHIQALWLASSTGDDRIIIAVVPEYFREAFSRSDVITPARFFDILRALPHIDGLVL